MKARLAEPLEMWTVYQRPADYPDWFVARRWLIDGGPEPVPTNRMLLGRTLDDVLLLMPPGLTMLGRADSDPVTVVGTWL